MIVYLARGDRDIRVTCSCSQGRRGSVWADPPDPPEPASAQIEEAVWDDLGVGTDGRVDLTPAEDAEARELALISASERERDAREAADEARFEQGHEEGGW